MPEYRFSGHDSFTCRYAWLPKAVREVRRDTGIFWKEDEAMVRLGVGKNMVRAIRFWAECAGVIEMKKQGKMVVTDFGTELLGDGGNGLDSFLEDIRTLWLLHWRLSTHPERPLFAWDFLLNRWQLPEMTASSVFKAFVREAPPDGSKVTEGVLEQMFELFVRSYVPTRGPKAEVREDNLDGPLVELQFLQQVGLAESTRTPGRTEPAYAFRREAKPEISGELFAYCVDEFWRVHHPKETTLPLPDLANGHGSPGQIFKLPEEDILRRAERIRIESGDWFDFQSSAVIPHLVRLKPATRRFPLAHIYNGELANV